MVLKAGTEVEREREEMSDWLELCSFVLKLWCLL